VIGCEDRLRNDLYCVEWGVKLYSNSNYTRPGKEVPVYSMPYTTSSPDGCRLVCSAVPVPGADAGRRTLHGSVREDAQPGDEVVLDDGQLSAFDTPSTQGNRQPADSHPACVICMDPYAI